MSRKIAAAIAVATTGLGVNAPPAAATHPFVRCRMVAVSHDPTSGPNTYTGIAIGVVVGGFDELVTIRCVVKDRDEVLAATSWGAGRTTATTSDSITFIQTTYDTAFFPVLCAQYYTATHGGGDEPCIGLTRQQVPPWEIDDVILDPGREAACATLRRAAGGYGVAEVKPDGDLYVNFRLVLDCIPYEPAGPTPDTRVDMLTG